MYILNDIKSKKKFYQKSGLRQHMSYFGNFAKSKDFLEAFWEYNGDPTQEMYVSSSCRSHFQALETIDSYDRIKIKIDLLTSAGYLSSVKKQELLLQNEQKVEDVEEALNKIYCSCRHNTKNTAPESIAHMFRKHSMTPSLVNNPDGLNSLSGKSFNDDFTFWEKYPDQNYFEIEEEIEDLRIWRPFILSTRPLVLLPVFLLLAFLGGNPLLAANCLKSMLFDNGTLEWMPSSEVTYHVNNAIAFGLGIHLISFIPASYFVCFIGPKYLSTIGFLLLSIGWSFIGFYQHYCAVVFGCMTIAIGSSFVYTSVQSLSNLFSTERIEIEILGLLAVSEGAGCMIPKSLELIEKLIQSPSRVIIVVCLWISILLLSSLLSFFVLPNRMPLPRSRHIFSNPVYTRVKEIINQNKKPEWYTFLWDERERLNQLYKKFFSRSSDLKPTHLTQASTVSFKKTCFLEQKLALNSDTVTSISSNPNQNDFISLNNNHVKFPNRSKNKSPHIVSSIDNTPEQSIYLNNDTETTHNLNSNLQLHRVLNTVESLQYPDQFNSDNFIQHQERIRPTIDYLETALVEDFRKTNIDHLLSSQLSNSYLDSGTYITRSKHTFWTYLLSWFVYEEDDTNLKKDTHIPNNKKMANLILHSQHILEDDNTLQANKHIPCQSTLINPFLSLGTKMYRRMHQRSMIYNDYSMLNPAQKNNKEINVINEKVYSDVTKNVLMNNTKGTLLSSKEPDPRLIEQLYASSMDNNEYNSNEDHNMLRLPLWDLGYFASLCQPQTIVLFILFYWMQFSLLERFLSGHAIINSTAHHSRVATYYQHIFDLALPVIPQCFLFSIIVGILNHVVVEWRRLVAILVFINLFIFLSFCSCLSQMVWIQLISFTCFFVSYPLLKSFPLVVFLYLFGKDKAQFLVNVSFFCRGLSCFSWVFWQSFSIIVFQEHVSPRILVMTIAAGAAFVPIVLLYLLEPGAEEDVIRKQKKSENGEIHYVSEFTPVRLFVFGTPMLPQHTLVDARCFRNNSTPIGGLHDCFGREWVPSSM